MSLISEAMHSVVGVEYDRQVSFPVASSDIRKWAVAIYYPEDPPRLFWDESYAQGSRWAGIVAPEDFNPFAWMIAEPAMRQPDRDENLNQLEKALGIEGPKLDGYLAGGITVEYGMPIRPGDVITSVRRLAEYKEKTGRLGPMLLTTTEETWTNQQRELVKTLRRTGIRYQRDRGSASDG